MSWHEDPCYGPSIHAVTTESARDWSNEDLSGHCEGDGIPWDHVFASRVDRPSGYAGVVRQVRENHYAILRYATLDPELPRWAFLRKGLADHKWDLVGPMTQAYSRPTGREKSMVYNDQTQQWERLQSL